MGAPLPQTHAGATRKPPHRYHLRGLNSYIPANVDFGLRDAKFGPAVCAAVKKIIADSEAEHPEIAGGRQLGYGS